MPIRIWTARCASVALCSCKACWMATAALTAATVDGKEIRNPSPRELLTWPPSVLTSSRTMAACKPRISSASRSPRDRRSAVEPTTSVIMIASALAARLRSDNGCLPFSCSSRAPAHQSTAASGRSLHRTCAWCPGPGTPQFQVTLGLARIPPARTPLDVRPPLQAFGLGGVAGHPKGAIGRQRLVEQLGGLLLVSSATTVEQHPGSQAA
jgi:hypothetical protein